VSNCKAGGGVAAVIFQRNDIPECEQMTGMSLLRSGCDDSRRWALPWAAGL
jgi:hypothetical protein